MAGVRPPEIEIRYHRRAGDTRRFRQELLHDGARHKITLAAVGPDDDPVTLGGEAVVEPGGLIFWFSFPGRPYEIASAFGRDGTPLGMYTNIIRPATLTGDVWNLQDLVLDVWQPPERGDPRLLDADELAEARRTGLIEAADAELASGTAARVLDAARRGAWPPRFVRRIGPDEIPALRFHRDAPGTYWANLWSGRLIAAGIYALGLVSLTSAAFAALRDASGGRGVGSTAWLVAVGLELALLLPLALAGRLPATGRPRPREAMHERTLFIGTLVTSAAVFLNPAAASWRAALSGVYGTLAVFLIIFAVCRAGFDRRFPAVAAGGIAVCAVALLVLL
ncbi:MAG: DUF402 domain-containing protein [Gemmatimonadota bacterium]